MVSQKYHQGGGLSHYRSVRIGFGGAYLRTYPERSAVSARNIMFSGQPSSNLVDNSEISREDGLIGRREARSLISGGRL
jgi:hypothetical protein